ncbi:MAG: hypothetical protein ACYTE8_00495 [Planctomycetota bacterium]|jgi:hypothetical protein
MAMDFEAGTIEVREDSVNYGPFSFDMEDAAPTDAVISSVTVTSYSGKVQPSAELADETETTSSLIDSLLTAATGDYVVSVYFNYPGYSLEGNHTVVITITWDNTAVHSYFFYKVKVN